MSDEIQAVFPRGATTTVKVREDLYDRIEVECCYPDGHCHYTSFDRIGALALAQQLLAFVAGAASRDRVIMNIALRRITDRVRINNGLEPIGFEDFDPDGVAAYKKIVDGETANEFGQRIAQMIESGEMFTDPGSPEGSKPAMMSYDPDTGEYREVPPETVAKLEEIKHMDAEQALRELHGLTDEDIAELKATKDLPNPTGWQHIHGDLISTPPISANEEKTLPKDFSGFHPSEEFRGVCIEMARHSHRLKVVKGEQDDSTDPCPGAFEFLKLDEKRVGRDFRVYDILAQCGGAHEAIMDFSDVLAHVNDNVPEAFASVREKVQSWSKHIDRHGDAWKTIWVTPESRDA